MCLIAFAWQPGGALPLVVAANRDEWRERPAAAAMWWRDAPSLLAGRDLLAGGTWLGVTHGGRFAALTNFRDPSDRRPDAPSRGALVRDFLLSDRAPLDWLRELRAHAGRYQGFNLLAGDMASLFCLGSRAGDILPVPPGMHALSNHTLDEPWPKVRQARSALDAALRAEMPWEARQMAIHALLSSAQATPDEELPDTGVGLAWERMLSPALITGERYGTRCSTLVAIDAGGHALFEERTRDAAGGVVSAARFHFDIAR